MRTFLTAPFLHSQYLRRSGTEFHVALNGLKKSCVTHICRWRDIYETCPETHTETHWLQERAWAPCIRRLVVQQVEILRNSEQPLLRLDFNECVCGWLPAALNLGGRVICVLISTEQREKEGKLFLFLWVCNKAPCSKSFNLSRNEGYISVFWLLRTISPSLSLSAFHSHTFSPNHCWNRACLVNGEPAELPLLTLTLSFCLCTCRWAKVSRSWGAGVQKSI